MGLHCELRTAAWLWEDPGSLWEHLGSGRIWVLGAPGLWEQLGSGRTWVLGATGFGVLGGVGGTFGPRKRIGG